MSFPVTCTCGFPLGQYAAAFTEKSRRLIAAHFVANDNETLPRNVYEATGNFTPGGDIDQFPSMAPVFEAWGIRHDCCKAKLLATVDFFKFRQNTQLAFPGEGTLTGAELTGKYA